MDSTFTKVSFEIEDGRFTVSEWDEMGDVLMIEYAEEELESCHLPVLTKEQWEALKRAGDYVFSEIEAAKM
tara:strand:- start:1807 stop:2019 length:213 start_codon:yes stop_codon:yes gene_type:complete